MFLSIGEINIFDFNVIAFYLLKFKNLKPILNPPSKISLIYRYVSTHEKLSLFNKYSFETPRQKFIQHGQRRKLILLSIFSFSYNVFSSFLETNFVFPATSTFSSVCAFNIIHVSPMIMYLSDFVVWAEVNVFPCSCESSNKTVQNQVVGFFFFENTEGSDKQLLFFQKI